MPHLSNCTVGVIGAGAMGAGIAEVAATAGHSTLLFDTNTEAVTKALAGMESRFASRVARGKLEQAQADSVLGNITPVTSLEALAPCSLVIEAIVERLDIKRSVFSTLEDIVSTDTILTSNTSSISITELAAGLKRPHHFAGLHFFNPAPVMKLVEVIAGLQTAPEVIDALMRLGADWGKVPARARSVPGFIVNRVARAYYSESFLALEQGAATPEQIDAVMTEAAGFRMGPMTLTDLIGHDVNLAVARSIFEAYDGATRFRPSLAQKELVAAGRLGRKSGYGIYDYSEGAQKSLPYLAVSDTAKAASLTVSPDASGLAASLRDAADAADITVTSDPSLKTDQYLIGDVLIATSDGASALTVSQKAGRPVLVLDWMIDPAACETLAAAPSPDLTEEAVNGVAATLAGLGRKLILIKDRPGLIALRIICMLINTACDAARDQVASEEDIDLAMRYGVNYPTGPFDWARRIGPARVESILSAIQAETGDPIYAPSEYLMRLARTGN